MEIGSGFTGGPKAMHIALRNVSIRLDRILDGICKIFYLDKTLADLLVCLDQFQNLIGGFVGIFEPVAFD